MTSKSKPLYCFFQHVPPTANATARRAKSILESYSRDGIDLVLLTTSTSKFQNIKTVQIRDDSKGSLQKNKLLRLLSEIKIGFKVTIHLWKVGSVDRFLLSIPSYFIALPVCVYLWTRQIPYVLEVRDVYPESLEAANVIKKNSLIARSLRAFSKRMYDRSQGIIVPTNGAKEIISRYVDKKRISVVYNGFEISELEKEKFEKFTVVFHGTLGEFQDIEGLILLSRALAGYDIPVHVIGSGTKAHLLEDAENLDYIGHLSAKQTLRHISRCHLGISLRTNDEVSEHAFPVKVWEYIGMRIPVIVSPPCEAGKFLVQNKLGFEVEFRDIQALVQIILEIRNGLQLPDFNLDKYTRSQTGRQAMISVAHFFGDPK